MPLPSTSSLTVGEARPPECAKYSAAAVATTAAKSVGDGDARPPGIAKQSVKSESDFAESSGGAGPSWSRATGSARHSRNGSRREVCW